MRKTLLAACLAVVLSGCGSSVSGEPMPLNRESLSRVDQAAKEYPMKHRELADNAGDADKTLTLMIDWISKVYEDAGYSFEATVISVDQVLNHSEQEQPEWEAQFVIPQITNIVSRLHGIAKDGKIDLNDYLHEDTVRAVNSLADSMRSKL